MKHNTFYKNTLWQYGLQILKYLFPLLLIPYLTRILGTEGYAVYAYVLSFMGVVQTIADFGFTLSGTKKVVDLRGGHCSSLPPRGGDNGRTPHVALRPFLLCHGSNTLYSYYGREYGLRHLGVLCNGRSHSAARLHLSGK